MSGRNCDGMRRIASLRLYAGGSQDRAAQVDVGLRDKPGGSRVRGLARARRRGLAPLELVLAIPLLMFAVALCVIIGAVACWKVRAEVQGRDAIFSRRYGRGGAVDPQPVEWRVATAVRGDRGGRAMTELDHAVFQNPLIRGPLPNAIGVDNEMLDPTNHARVGYAQLTRDPPALGKLGPYSLNVEQPLLDGKWQYWQLGIGNNTSRRVRRLYDLLNVPAAQDEKARYQQAMQQTTAIYMRREMEVLDRDDEFYAWRGSSPDFHPRLPRFCSLDVMDARQRYVERHIPRIDSQPRPSNPNYDPPGVPHRMASAFLGMYRQQLRVLENTPPPLSSAQQAQMAELQRKIAILEDFLASLN